MATTSLSQESVRQVLGRTLHNFIEDASKKHFPDWDTEPFGSLPQLNQLEMVDAAEAFANHLCSGYTEMREALKGILEIGKRDMSNPKYDGYFEAAQAALKKAEVTDAR